MLIFFIFIKTIDFTLFFVYILNNNVYIDINNNTTNHKKNQVIKLVFLSFFIFVYVHLFMELFLYVYILNLYKSILINKFTLIFKKN